MARRIVIIGGSAAGAKAAAKARRVDPDAGITIIQKEPNLSQASCGFPYYVGGTFDNRNALIASPWGAPRNAEFFLTTKNITALTETEALAIDRSAKKVQCRTAKSDDTFTVDYDKLICCTGARARRLPVPGSERAGITTLLSMEDSDLLHSEVTAGRVKSAVIVGGGLIGVETCEALVAHGIRVTLVEMTPQILTMLDPQLAALVANHMKMKGVELRLGTRVEAFEGEERVSGVRLANGETIACELVVSATGVQPDSEIAREAGLDLGELGGIRVNEFMQTSDPDIYAAGDCVECVHRITGSSVLSPMGDLANLQGRVAGENAATGREVATFSGTQQTAICQVFAWKAGVTGLTETAAQRFGVTDYETVVIAGPDKPGFMGAGILVSKMLVAKKSEKILGFQCVGMGDVSRQLAAMAVAVQAGMTVTELGGADMPYAPPFSNAIDHCITAAHVIENKLKGRFKGISAAELWNKIEAGRKPFLLTGCEVEEYRELNLGLGEKIIPIGEVRRRLDELPQEKTTEIVCWCKISLRGYELSLFLESEGYTNVRVLEGGTMGWPYPRG